MTSGSRGVHVVVPLRRRYGFDRVHEAALRRRRRARLAPAGRPDHGVPQGRSATDRLFVDVLRTRYGQLAVAPYAVRARPGAPVATPLRDERARRRRAGLVARLLPARRPRAPGARRRPVGGHRPRSRGAARAVTSPESRPAVLGRSPGWQRSRTSSRASSSSRRRRSSTRTSRAPSCCSPSTATRGPWGWCSTVRRSRRSARSCPTSTGSPTRRTACTSAGRWPRPR